MENEYIFKRTAYYYNWILNSPSGEYAQQYLQNRGISLSIANNFLIGATSKHDNGDHNTNALTKELMKNANAYDVIASRLSRIRNNKDTFEVVDYFTTDRIIFPIISNGSPVYFIGRSTNKNEKIRFINIKDIKMNCLFNQDVIQSSVEEIYLTEGVMDALTIESMGKSAIACLGTSGIRPAHRHLFDGTNKRYVFVFDSDENGSGDKAVLRSASVLRSFGIDSLFKINLPRKNGQKKTDINQLLIRAGNAEKLKEWFDKRERHIIHVEPYQEPMCQSTDNKQSNTKIYKIVSRYIPLTQINPILYKGKCPFHDDNNPSLHVYINTNTFKCFGCGKFGDSAQFLQDLHNISFNEATTKIKNEF